MTKFGLRLALAFSILCSTSLFAEDASTKPTVTNEENLSISTKPETGEQARRKLAPKGESKLFSWWSPEAYRFSVGYERGGGPTSVLSSDNLTFGAWFGESFGMDFFLGYSKQPGTTAQSTTVQETGTTTKSRTTVDSFSGSTAPSNFIVGTALKIKGYQNSWFQFYYGAIFAYSSGGKTESNLGTRTEIIPDTNNPGNRTVTDTGFGSISSETKGIFSVGPKIGTEFYIKWFPHLALGMATGILASFGGDTTQVQSVRNRTTNFINGVEQPDLTGSAPVVTTTNITPNGQATTFGVGGTNFSFTGIFSIRYIW